MSHRGLLKAPTRVLLLTFVMSAGVAVVTPVPTSQTAPVPGPAHHRAIANRSRTRQPLEEMDAYVLLHGIPRWGLNE